MFISPYVSSIIIFVIAIIIFIVIDMLILMFFLKTEDQGLPGRLYLNTMGIIFCIIFFLTLFTFSTVFGFIGLFAVALVFRPMLKHEQTRMFLDIIKFSIGRGVQPERTFAELGEIKGAGLGSWVNKVNPLVESGVTFVGALRKLNTGVPESIINILYIGELTGNIAKVLPSCYKTNSRQISKTRARNNYYILPCVFLSFIFFSGVGVFILPKIGMIARECGAKPVSSSFAGFLFNNSGDIGALTFVVIFLFVVLMVFFPCLKKVRLMYSYLQYYVMPGQRKKLLKDFALMLSILLEAGINEQEAVVLAGDATNNEIFTEKSSSAAILLSDGVSLPEVLEKYFDTTGEFAWRFKNCSSSSGDKEKFSRSIADWCSWLEASAFRSEQVFAQICASLLLLLAAIPIYLVAHLMFYTLIKIMDAVVIW